MLKILLAISQSLMSPTKNNKTNSATCGIDDSIPLSCMDTPKIS